MMTILLPFRIFRWLIVSDFGEVRLKSICANQSRILRILSSGGLLTVMSIQIFLAWLWTISASPVNYLFITISCHVTKFPPIATSTAVERVFSQGRQLLSFTRNRLSASSIRADLCLGSWGRNDLIYFEDVLAAVKGNAKRKREEYDSEVEVVEYE